MLILNLRMRDDEFLIFKEMIEAMLEEGTSGVMDRQHMILGAKILLQLDEHEYSKPPPADNLGAPTPRAEAKKTW